MQEPLLGANATSPVSIATTAGTFLYDFDPAHITAINVAYAAERPLLIRGEPGIGKSQLARAAAKACGRSYMPTVLTARTEPGELLFESDAVARLAQAQILGATQAAADKASRAKAIQDLSPANFVRPGILWWAFNRPSADLQAKKLGATRCPFELDAGETADAGAVVLIDEIDKADPSVPNALLEAFGNGRFSVPLCGDEVVRMQDPKPLVVITTNAERALPDAFVRRCMVLHMRFPSEDDLVARASAHTGNQGNSDLFRTLAKRLLAIRGDREGQMGRPPGQAEYLDLCRALVALHGDDVAAQETLLKKVESLAFSKHQAPENQRSAGPTGIVDGQ